MVMKESTDLPLGTIAPDFEVLCYSSSQQRVARNKTLEAFAMGHTWTSTHHAGVVATDLLVHKHDMSSISRHAFVLFSIAVLCSYQTQKQASWSV
jgi:hypothetical protein